MKKSHPRFAFFNFLNAESSDFGPKLIWLTIAAGVINGVLITIIISAAPLAVPGQLNFRHLALFAIAFAAFFFIKKHVLDKTNIIVEGIIDNVRMRIAEKIRKSDLLVFEKMDKNLLQSAVATHTQIISQASSLIINSASSGMMIIFAAAFIFFISKMAFMITAIVIGAALMIYMSTQQKVIEYYQKAADKEGEFFGAFSDLINGFKELKINSKKEASFFNDKLRATSLSAQELKIKVGSLVNQNMLLSQTTFYVLLAAIIFLLPNIEPDDSGTLIALSSVILFIVGPISELVTSISFLARATISVTEIQKFESQLNLLDNLEEQQPQLDVDKPIDFQSISCQKVAFSYENKTTANHRFQLGPIDFSINKGEIIFIVGGNGSGKSTFLKLLTGLYSPQAGSLQVNSETLSPRSYRRYRNLFSPVFSDFHLFDQIYGIDDLDEVEVDQLLHKMELNDRTQVIDKRITNTQLSTGQRKRLVLVLAIVEKKPIFIFDEWAADQDPTFRAHFYEEILPQMKREGKTILAATHDDKYFGIADKVFKFEDGRMAEVDI